MKINVNPKTVDKRIMTNFLYSELTYKIKRWIYDKARQKYN